MTLSANSDRRKVYNGNGSTRVFSVDFPFHEIEVYVGGVLKTLGIDYVIVQENPGETGSVDFNADLEVSPPPAGTGNVVIVATTEIEQTVDYGANDQFPAETHEAALDRLTMIAQELAAKIGKSLRGLDTQAGFSALDFAGNPNSIIRTNESGVPQLVPASTLAGSVAQSVIEDAQNARDLAVAAAAAAAASQAVCEAIEATAGVASFNSRNGAVVPTAGDYDAFYYTKAEVDNLKSVGLEIEIDGGGSAITPGIKGYYRIPFACTLTAHRLVADQSGSIVIDLWKDTYANFPPTDADSITASTPPTLSSAQKAEDTTLSGWTKTFAAGDWIAVNVDSASTVTYAKLSLSLTRADLE
jgi:hypothetical protein